MEDDGTPDDPRVCQVQEVLEDVGPRVARGIHERPEPGRDDRVLVDAADRGAGDLHDKAAVLPRLERSPPGALPGAPDPLQQGTISGLHLGREARHVRPHRGEIRGELRGPEHGEGIVGRAQLVEIIAEPTDLPGGTGS